MALRLLVCGGRDYTDREGCFAALDKLRRKFDISVLIHGEARGADNLAGEWAEANGIETLRFPADWRTHGKAAGPIRNRQMLTEGKPNVVVAFPGGRGTADMIDAARAAGLTVWEPYA